MRGEDDCPKKEMWGTRDEATRELSSRGDEATYCIVRPRNVVDSIQAINGQNADKIIGLTLFVCF